MDCVDRIIYESHRATVCSTVSWASHPPAFRAGRSIEVSLCLVYVFALSVAIRHLAAGILAIHLFIKQKLCFSVVLAYLCPCSVYKECTRWLNYSIVKVLLRCFLFGSPQYSVLGSRGFIPSLIRTKRPRKLTCFPSNPKNKYKFSESAQKNRRIWLLNAAKCAYILGFCYKDMENRTDYNQIHTFANLRGLFFKCLQSA